MRNKLPIILILISVIILSSCQYNPTPDNTAPDSFPAEEMSVTTEETQLQTESPQLPLYAISLPVISKNTATDSGIVAFRYVYQNITLIHPEPEVADRVILDFLNQQDAVTAYADSSAEAAKQAFDKDGSQTAHLLQMLFAPMRFDGGILSLYGDKVSYTGGAHSVYSGQSLNYDLLTGERLQLPDLLQDSGSADILKEKISDALTVIAEEKQLFQTYADILSFLVPTELSSYTSWYLTDEGLVFYFAPGEIAPYASGSIIAEIPYSKLTGIIRDDYFPAETVPEDGNVYVQIFETSGYDEYSRFSELILDKGSTKILLHADGTVRNIRLSEISISADSNGSSHDTVLYAAYTLSPNDAVLIEADLNSVHLKLSYENKTGLQEFALHPDGASVILEKY